MFADDLEPIVILHRLCLTWFAREESLSLDAENCGAAKELPSFFSFGLT